MQGNRRDRSRSPMKTDSVGRQRDDKNQDGNKFTEIQSSMSNMPTNVMNPMMMTNMYSQGNMMMGGMYPNMMMQGMMGGAMIPPTGMDMMSNTAMDIMPQAQMEISGIGTQPIASAAAPTMDMTMMGGMMVDPSMIGIYSGIGGEITAVPEKKEIVLKHCKLIPPAPGIPEPLRRAKPPGCRTVFVGKLPDKIRESTLREIFETFGRIHTMRLSKRNFCHIRYDREESVDAAMAISGYRVKVTSKDKDKDDKQDDEDSHSSSGCLHVDYALCRDDQNDYERRQRQVLRAQQVELEQLNAQQEMAVTHSSSSASCRRTPSPVRIQPYSNVAMVQLYEKLKNEEHFSSTLPTLLAWMERGECSKKNANQFYSMIQATNSHIRRLFSDKMQAEEELDELQTSREKFKNQIANIIDQLEQVAKVFIAAAHQRIWDHFTKPQRKNIETWQKMTQEFKTLKEEFREKFYGDYNEFGFSNRNTDSNNEEIEQLKRENESLQFQLEAYKNEIDVIKADAQQEMEKFKAQFIARQALQNAMDKNQPPLPSPIVKPPPPPPLPGDIDSVMQLKDDTEVGCGEAKLIGVMSAFLQVHPQGASLDYVVSYVRALFPNVTQATIHHVLQKYSDVFNRTTTGVGANIEHRWSFIAFNKIENT